MNKKFGYYLFILFNMMPNLVNAAPDRTQLVVWANEAIIATYTYDYQNFTQQQKEIAHYFTANGWIAYNKALTASKLPEAIQKNRYQVSAVATQPPILTTLDSTHWSVTMPILVMYSNPQYQQKQNLNVILNFSIAPPGQGVRGFTVDSLLAKITTPPCQCLISKKDYL